MAGLIIEESKPNTCSVTVKSPYRTLVSEDYLVFTKIGTECSIECNGLTYEELVKFQVILDDLIRKNKSAITGEGDTTSGYN